MPLTVLIASKATHPLHPQHTPSLLVMHSSLTPPSSLHTHTHTPQELASKEEFPLPTLGPKLEAFTTEVVHGKGFHLFRGFPVHKFSRWQTVCTYYAFGLWFGHPQAQNAKGHTVGEFEF